MGNDSGDECLFGRSSDLSKQEQSKQGRSTMIDIDNVDEDKLLRLEMEFYTSKSKQKQLNSALEPHN